MSMQSTSFKVTLTVAYLVTLPTACLFAFTLGYSVKGLVYGAAAGHGVQALLYWLCLVRQDWEKISEEAAVRIKEDNTKQQELASQKSA